MGPDSTLILLDWDDTLLPTTALRSGTFSYSASALYQLARLEDSAIQLLSLALTLGQLIIVTNAEEGWVQQSASRYYPRLATMLQHIPVVSARTQHEGEFASPTAWKAAAFAYALHEHCAAARRAGLQTLAVSIGDSTEELTALSVATAQHSDCRASSIKLLLLPSMATLAVELDLVRPALQAICSRPSANTQIVIKPFQHPQKQHQKQMQLAQTTCKLAAATTAAAAAVSAQIVAPSLQMSGAVMSVSV